MTRLPSGGARRPARAASLILSAAAVLLAALPFGGAGAASHRPARSSLEYRLSWGVGATQADRAYGRGATGRGVTVAMIDTGIDPPSRDLFANLSPDSADMVPDRKSDDGDRRHGRRTATLLAARLDGRGTLGIAYDATLLSIRADRDGSCRKTCTFDADILSRAIDYAADHGARVIGLPLASKRPMPGMEAALARAVERGIVIVAAAGNFGGAQPAWPAQYAADPRFARSMLVAGAISPRGRLPAWSNKAGAAAARYLVAPGERLPVDCGTSRCTLTSGTSYSVSYVAGAAALLLSRYPDLDGPAAAEALLESARPVGASLVEAGRGRLDIDAAFRAAAEAKGEGREA